jgi:hypothetical protein
MIYAIAAIIPLGLFIGLKIWHSHQQPTPISESDSAEVFRGPTDAARTVISRLADAGVNAWVEDRKGDDLVIHVEQEVLPQIATLLNAATQQAQAEASQGAA